MSILGMEADKSRFSSAVKFLMWNEVKACVWSVQYSMENSLYFWREMCVNPQTYFADNLDINQKTKKEI